MNGGNRPEKDQANHERRQEAFHQCRNQVSVQQILECRITLNFKYFTADSLKRCEEEQGEANDEG